MDLLALYSNQELWDGLGDLQRFAADSTPIVPGAPPVRQQQTRLTQEQVAELLVAYTEGTPAITLAKRYGIHRHTVVEHLERHGIPRRQCLRVMTDEQVRKAAEYYQAGESLKTVGAQFGTSPRTIARELRAIGVEIRPRSGW